MTPTSEEVSRGVDAAAESNSRWSAEAELYVTCALIIAKGLHAIAEAIRES